MTAPSRPLWEVVAHCALPVPATPMAHEISIIIPVKNNPAGISRLLASLGRATLRPKEVIVVDNCSVPALRPPDVIAGFSTVLVREPQPGPAAARNAGARMATGTWLLFVDSDCELAPDCLAQWEQIPGGALGYAGLVRAADGDGWSRYYDEQGILWPAPDRDGNPAYLITAHCLIARSAWLAAGGFDAGFPLAAGEDIDLALRLRQFGKLAYWGRSTVYHDFGPGARSFVSRFRRYGAGNWRLQDKYGYDLAPRPFAANGKSMCSMSLAILQFVALAQGYWVARCKTSIAEQFDHWAEKLDGSR